MIKCLFVDIKNIHSATPKSKFTKSKIEKLADSILETDGLIRPLVIQQTDIDRYIVIEGHLEYYAAVRAKEKDLHKAEMVNAFIIPANSQEFALKQLSLLSKTTSIPTSTSSQPNLPSPDPVTSIADVVPTELFDRLSAHLTAELSHRLAPIEQQLASVATEVTRLSLHPTADITRLLQPLQHQLDTIVAKLDGPERMLASASANAPVTQLSNEPSISTEPIMPPTVEIVARSKNASTTTTSRKRANSQAKHQPDKLPTVQSQPIEPAIKPDELSAPLPPGKKSTTTKKTPSAITTPKNLVKSDVFAAIDPEKLERTLQLINTLDLNDLTLSMARSRIASAETLAANIIDKRDTQPQQRFETWEAVILAKVTKLTSKAAIDLINKLK